MCVYGFGRINNTHNTQIKKEKMLNYHHPPPVPHLVSFVKRRGKRDARHTCVCVRQLLLFDYKEEEEELLTSDATSPATNNYGAIYALLLFSFSFMATRKP